MQNRKVTLTTYLAGLVFASAVCASATASSTKSSYTPLSGGANAFANASAYSVVEVTQTINIDFGVHSDEDPTTVVRTYMPALKALERSMTTNLNAPVDIRMHIARDKSHGLDLLINRDVDFKAVDTEDFLEMRDSGIDLRVIAAQNAKNSNTLSPWVARAGLDDSIYDALKESLLSFKDRNVLSKLNLLGFVQSSTSQYQIVDEIQSNNTRYIPKRNSSRELASLESVIKASTTEEKEPQLLAAMPIPSDNRTSSHIKENMTASRDMSINIVIPEDLLELAEKTNSSNVNVVIDLKNFSTTPHKSVSID